MSSWPGFEGNRSGRVAGVVLLVLALLVALSVWSHPGVDFGFARDGVHFYGSGWHPSDRVVVRFGADEFTAVAGWNGRFDVSTGLPPSALEEYGYAWYHEPEDAPMGSAGPAQRITTSAYGSE